MRNAEKIYGNELGILSLNNISNLDALIESKKFIGKGGSKQQAEQDAATKLLDALNIN